MKDDDLTGLLSIVLLSYNSAKSIRRCYERLGAVLDEARIPFEFIVMDDGSTDDSYSVACDLEHEKRNVRAYRLSRNCGTPYSIFAGLSLCRGACAMPMVDDEQQPYDTVVAMYRLWQSGHKVVIPCRERRDDSWLSSALSNAFYRVMNALSDVRYPPGGADLFFIDREVLDVINARIHPINTFGILEVLRLGFDPCFLPYHRPLGLNGGKSRWTFRKKLRLAKDNFFSSSTFPLKVISAAGWVAFLGSLAAGAFYVYIALWGNQAFWGVRVPGWTFIVVLLFALGGVLLLALGVLAEYVWRIYDEVKDRPGYVIMKKEDDVG